MTCVQSRRCYTHIPSVDISERLSLILILKISVYQILKLNESQEVGTWLASKSKHMCQHIGICPRPLALFPKTDGNLRDNYIKHRLLSTILIK